MILINILQANKILIEEITIDLMNVDQELDQSMKENDNKQVSLPLVLNEVDDKGNVNLCNMFNMKI